ncbi:hypothetical protein BDK51DRAFT_41017 [Blyttiomyces helicus]|uniref:MYND-type domain-containing protein n=1 Tax=Blyttiomyces helicus TaxID=388810 RepID=A0A4P9W8G3_9FUNG|nr:hypothetical protein BDK51DRAFT_41017 [Blyttiomyces helicus]|eukprot:RKO86456.1 hypothetical protein BDK51DRAFT_41017 [Blyttiomyces helicus]
MAATGRGRHGLEIVRTTDLSDGCGYAQPAPPEIEDLEVVANALTAKTPRRLPSGSVVVDLVDTPRVLSRTVSPEGKIEAGVKRRRSVVAKKPTPSGDSSKDESHNTTSILDDNDDDEDFELPVAAAKKRRANTRPTIADSYSEGDAYVTAAAEPVESRLTAKSATPKLKPATPKPKPAPRSSKKPTAAGSINPPAPVPAPAPVVDDDPFAFVDERRSPGRPSPFRSVKPRASAPVVVDSDSDADCPAAGTWQNEPIPACIPKLAPTPKLKPTLKAKPKPFATASSDGEGAAEPSNRRASSRGSALKARAAMLENLDSEPRDDSDGDSEFSEHHPALARVPLWTTVRPSERFALPGWPSNAAEGCSPAFKPGFHGLCKYTDVFRQKRNFLPSAIDLAFTRRTFISTIEPLLDRVHCGLVRGILTKRKGDDETAAKYYRRAIALAESATEADRNILLWMDGAQQSGKPYDLDAPVPTAATHATYKIPLGPLLEGSDEDRRRFGNTVLERALYVHGSESKGCGASAVFKRLKYCRGCKRAAYCSTACQEGAWAVHRPSCRPPHSFVVGDLVRIGGLTNEAYQDHNGSIVEVQGPVADRARPLAHVPGPEEQPGGQAAAGPGGPCHQRSEIAWLRVASESLACQFILFFLVFLQCTLVFPLCPMWSSVGR